MSGIAQTLQPPPPVSVQTLLYGIYQAASNGGGGGGGSTAWGSITGTLSNQTDLSTALAGKLAIASNLSDLANAATARTNLGVTATGADTTYAFRSNNLSDLANASTARTNLGLGTIATQAASAVAITGGTLAGLTGLGIRSTGAAFDLTLASSEALTAGRTLSFNVGDANRTLTIPATGTVALLGTANNFTSGQTIAPSSAATPLTLTGGTVTTALPVLDMTQTWNNGAVTFTGIKLNVTNTASAAASRFLRLQAGGSDKCTIDLNGSYYGGIGGAEFSLFADTTEVARCVITGFRLATQPICFGANHALNTFRLLRDGADHVLAQVGSTNAQTKRIYGTYTDASNYTRLSLAATSTTMTIACETAGTGADDIDLTFTPAGTGVVRFGTHSAVAAETVTGYITIKDSGGTTRKLAVIS